MSEAIMNAEARAAGFLALLEAMAAGGDPEAVKAAAPLVADARPEDLVGAVDAAVARGMEFSLLKPAVSKLVNLLATPLKARGRVPPAGERLLTSLMAENAGLLATLERGKALAKAVNDPGHGSEALRQALRSLRDLVEELEAVEAHYRKKEYVLFPWFEATYPRYRCVRLMWEIQDDARKGLKDVARLLDSALADADLLADFDPRPLNQAIGRLYFDLFANAFREDYALFPVMLGLIQPRAGERLFAESREYGYAFLDDEAVARLDGPEAEAAAERYARSRSPADGAPPEAALAVPGEAALSAASGFSGRTGCIPADALAAIFGALPVDMTYVDADDRVAWFSDSPRRIFPRSPAIIGRDVRNCHPGASVGRVVAIIDSFKRGDKNREAFWLTMGGSFVHIEYFALRAPDGAYLGVLEASQDLTALRALTGEKRLAD